MPKVRFIPDDLTFEAAANTKILAVANRNKVNIRFGCASCRCGTCAVKVSGDGKLSSMREDERELLTRMLLDAQGEIRLACQTKIESGEITIDLDFQNTYSADQGEVE
jgi:ferredoxin